MLRFTPNTLSLTYIQKQQPMAVFKKISRITRKTGSIRVYNFHVPRYENYVANGMITHNCYVARRKGYANPTTVFINTEEIHETLVRHVKSQRPKTPNQCDPSRWTYDIGENSDCSLDAKLSSNVERTVRLFSKSQSAKVCFATKTVNRDMLGWDPKGNTRVRFSLMPAAKSKLLDVRTSPVEDRIRAVSDFVEAGYEVHLNFSPVVVYDGWEADYANLFDQVRQTVSPKALAQLKCEVIFLTHNEGLHELNVRWHSKGEALLWRPDLQETKVSENGCQNLRYRYGLKGKYIQTFKALLGKHLPECGIRYIF